MAGEPTTAATVQHDQQYSVGCGSGRVFIDCFGAGGYEIEVKGEVVLFDWSERFGPLPVTKGGSERHLSHRHPFWRAVSLWSVQGKRLDGKRAIWHEPKRPMTRPGRIPGVRGVQQIIVEEGEVGWDW